MIALWPVARRAWMAALLGMFFVCWAGAAYAVSATLFVTPSPDVKPGDDVTFRMEVTYQDPAPVVLVYLDGAMWTTESQTVKYPGPGMTGTVKFAKPYTVPSDAKNASTLCFVPATGGGNVDVKQPIGEKKCVTVKFMVQIKKDVKVAQISKVAVTPDLAIAEVGIDQSNAKIVRARIVNQAGVASSPACTLCVQVRQWSGGGSKQLANKQAPVKALKAGEEVWIAVDTGVMGPFYYDLTIDCTNVVKESNENNNKGAMDRTIK